MKKLLTVIAATFAIAVFLMGSMAVSAAGEKAVERDGKKFIENTRASLDVTLSDKGVFSARVLTKYDKKVKVQISKGDKKVNYDLAGDTTSEVYPFQFGDGEYTVMVLLQVDTKYSIALNAKVNVKISDPNAPFLMSTKLINYNSDNTSVKKAAELIKTAKTDSEKAQAIYNYVVKALVYDTKKAEDVIAGKITSYIPKIDEIQKAGKGICFDYSTLLAAMFRSQGIPTKLVMGYVNTGTGTPQYHAWNEFYIKDKGWFKINEMKFEGVKYNRVDSTFESSSKSNAKVMALIGDGKNYNKTSEY